MVEGNGSFELSYTIFHFLFLRMYDNLCNLCFTISIVYKSTEQDATEDEIGSGPPTETDVVRIHPLTS